MKIAIFLIVIISVLGFSCNNKSSPLVGDWTYHSNSTLLMYEDSILGEGWTIDSQSLFAQAKALSFDTQHLSIDMTNGGVYNAYTMVNDSVFKISLTGTPFKLSFRIDGDTLILRENFEYTSPQVLRFEEGDETAPDSVVITGGIAQGKYIRKIKS